MNEVINYVMSSLIVIFGLGIAIGNYLIIKTVRLMGWRIIFSGIALYWVLIYGRLLFEPHLMPTGGYGATWVRPGLVFSLGFMFSMTVMRYKIVKAGVLPNDNNT